MSQVLAHGFTPPKRHAEQDVYEFMVTDFIDAVRTRLKAAGWARRSEEQEQGGCFLVGYQGRLFKVEGDYQVGESAYGYDAVGCGGDVACGSLFSTTGRLNPEDRVRTALMAAEAHNAGVRGPFLVLSTKQQ